MLSNIYRTRNLQLMTLSLPMMNGCYYVRQTRDLTATINYWSTPTRYLPADIVREYPQWITMHKRLTAEHQDLSQGQLPPVDIQSLTTEQHLA